MTKQHFETIARTMRDSRLSVAHHDARVQWFATVGELCNVFERLNPRFDRERFKRACGADV